MSDHERDHGSRHADGGPDPIPGLSSGGGGAPTGPAGGALDGTYPNPGLNATVAGAGLAETSDVLSVNVDASTIEISTDTLRVKDAGITSAKLAAAVAGNGLAGGAGTALSVNVDGTTIEINTDTLRVKAGGIGANEIAATAVTAASYGSAVLIPTYTVDADGRLTAAADVAIDAYSPAQLLNAQTGTTYTVVGSDAGKLVTCNNASAITVTLPQDSDLTFATGRWIEFLQLGAGQVTLAAGSGATVHFYPTAKTGGQYARLFAQKTAANTWTVGGATAAS